MSPLFVPQWGSLHCVCVCVCAKHRGVKYMGAAHMLPHGGAISDTWFLWATL